MSASNAFIGFGSLFKVGDGASPEAFTTVAELNSIKPGKMTTSVIDVTHHESPSTHREKKPGLKDTAAFTCAGNYLPTDATQDAAGTRGLSKLWQDRTIFNFEIVLADGNTTTLTGTGFVSGLEIGDLGTNDKVPVTFEITPTTAVPLP